MINFDTKWYVLYTKVGFERKVEKILARKKIESYCPMNRIVHSRGDRKKITLEPLFHAYVFAKMDVTQMEDVRRIDGVINLIYWINKPAEIGELEIEMIRFFLNSHVNVYMEKTPVNVKEVVRFISEPSIGREGNLMSVKVNKEKVILPTLGYLMTAEVEKVAVPEGEEKGTFYHNDQASYQLVIKQ